MTLIQIFYFRIEVYAPEWQYFSIPVKQMDGMEVPGIRTWVIFYLLSFVVLLWAAFLTMKGTMLWVSLMLVILVIGVNFAIVYSWIKKQASRKELQSELTKCIGKTAMGDHDDRPQH